MLLVDWVADLAELVQLLGANAVEEQMQAAGQGSGTAVELVQPAVPRFKTAVEQVQAAGLDTSAGVNSSVQCVQEAVDTVVLETAETGSDSLFIIMELVIHRLGTIHQHPHNLCTWWVGG